MFNSLLIFSETIRTFVNDPSFRGLIWKPFGKALRALFILLASLIVLSFVSCQYFIPNMQFEGLFIYVLVNLLLLLVVPPLFAIFYFSFFCESEYEKLCRYALLGPDSINLDVPNYNSLKLNDRSFFSDIMKLVFLIMIFSFVLIVSFFFVPVGLFLTGLILVWDFLSYPSNNLKLSMMDRVNYFTDNIVDLIIISLIFGLICLVPFSILFIYPFGVFALSCLMRNNAG